MKDLKKISPKVYILKQKIEKLVQDKQSMGALRRLMFNLTCSDTVLLSKTTPANSEDINVERLTKILQKRDYSDLLLVDFLFAYDVLNNTNAKIFADMSAKVEKTNKDDPNFKLIQDIAFNRQQKQPLLSKQELDEILSIYTVPYWPSKHQPEILEIRLLQSGRYIKEVVENFNELFEHIGTNDLQLSHYDLLRSRLEQLYWTEHCQPPPEDKIAKIKQEFVERDKQVAAEAKRMLEEHVQMIAEENQKIEQEKQKKEEEERKIKEDFEKAEDAKRESEHLLKVRDLLTAYIQQYEQELREFNQKYGVKYEPDIDLRHSLEKINERLGIGEIKDKKNENK